jgi:GTP cyclohydrolase-4
MNKTPRDPVHYRFQPEDLEGDFDAFLGRVTDVPSSPSLEGLAINEAGIADQQTYIRIMDIDGKGVEKPVFCTIEMSASLEEDQRGIHMSRCEEALFELTKETHGSIEDFAIKLTRAIREKQKSRGAMVRVSGPYIHEHVTPTTNQISHDKLYLLSEASVNGADESLRTGVRVYNINGCPCTRAYTKFSMIPALQTHGFTIEQIQTILDVALTGTHTQRGTISVVVDKTDDAITSGRIYEVINRSAHLVYELLKRPDEHALVKKVLEQPQFTEDVARQVALGVFNQFVDKAPGHTGVEVVSILNDSIHIHDVRTRISTTLDQIKQSLDHGTY